MRFRPVTTLLLGCLLWGVTADALSQQLPQHLDDRFEMELVAKQPTFARDGTAELIVSLKNNNPYPVTALAVMPHLQHATVTWLNASGKRDSSVRRQGSTLPIGSRVEAYGFENRRVLITKDKSAPADLVAVFEATYRLDPAPQQSYPRSLFRSVAIKGGESVGTMNISGIPLSLASYIIPGLFTIIVLGLFVPLHELIVENKYWFAIILSVLQVFLLDKLSAPSTHRSVNTEADFMYYAFSGMVCGALGGWFWRQMLPVYDRYPARDEMTMQELLATYLLQAGNVMGRISTVTVPGGDKYCGLLVKARGGRTAIVLPKKYRITFADNETHDTFEKALTGRNHGELARLLRKLPAKHVLSVTDGLQIVKGEKKPAIAETPVKNVPVASALCVESDEQDILVLRYRQGKSGLA